MDGEGGIAYLFGGRDGATIFADLWAYDLETDAWTELAPASPPPARFGHEAAWVDGVGLVVFAGQAGTTFFNDLWAYDPEPTPGRDFPRRVTCRWRATGPAAQSAPTAASGSATASPPTASASPTRRAYDFTTGAWTDETPSGDHPVERCLHACWTTDSGELTLYAGQTTGTPALGDRWTLGPDGWRRVEGTLPAERNLPAHARLDGATLVFGGMGLDMAFRDDLWAIGDDDPEAVMLVPEGSAPEPRAGAALVTDPARDRVLLFGGRATEGAIADTWSLIGVDALGGGEGA